MPPTQKSYQRQSFINHWQSRLFFTFTEREINYHFTTQYLPAESWHCQRVAILHLQLQLPLWLILHSSGKNFWTKSGTWAPSITSNTSFYSLAASPFLKQTNKQIQCLTIWHKLHYHFWVSNICTANCSTTVLLADFRHNTSHHIWGEDNKTGLDKVI